MHFKEKTYSYRFSPLWFVLLSAALGLTSCGGGSAGPSSPRIDSNTLKILTTSLGAGTVGQPYATQLTASGGGQPYTWSIAAGQFPTGLTMDSASGRITGTPGLPGNYSFTAEVRDSGPTQQQEATENLTVSIQLVPLTITTPDLPAGVLNAPYSLQMRASGGIPPYYWSVVSGTLPPGLELDPTTGRITGIPVGAGTFSFTIQVMDSNTPQSFARIFVGPPGRSPG